MAVEVAVVLAVTVAVEVAVVLAVTVAVEVAVLLAVTVAVEVAVVLAVTVAVEVALALVETVPVSVTVTSQPVVQQRCRCIGDRGEHARILQNLKPRYLSCSLYIYIYSYPCVQFD